MHTRIESSKVHMVFGLNLDAYLICDSKARFPIKICNKISEGCYLIVVSSNDFKLHDYKEFDIEIKGSIDVEDLKFQGNVFLAPIMSKHGCFKMHNIELFKSDSRRYKRVPYLRTASVKSFEMINVHVINISAGGVFIKSKAPIKERQIQISLPIQNKEVVLEAEVISNEFDELRKVYGLRCRFIHMKPKNEQLLNQLIMQIQIEARRRIQGMAVSK